jgi:two-component system phosphate regulon response regulator PhoB
MARILVIEDEPDLQKVLAYNLKQAGYEVLSALNGQKGLRDIKEGLPDLVLLDLMLPDIPGTEVCKSMKLDPKTRDIPVIMLTAKGEEIDRVLGFELGVEDYVVKPFSVRELLLRIAAVLRRAHSEPASPQAFRFGVLHVDCDAHRVWVAEQEIELTALEFKLLTTLYERRNRVQERAVLLEDVWQMDAGITTRTVDTHIKRLREKLGQAGEYIETVRGVGYRFAEKPQGESR